jgi:hypothetical protein
MASAFLCQWRFRVVGTIPFTRVLKNKHQAVSQGGHKLEA